MLKRVIQIAFLLIGGALGFVFYRHYTNSLIYHLILGLTIHMYPYY